MINPSWNSTNLLTNKVPVKSNLLPIHINQGICRDRSDKPDLITFRGLHNYYYYGDETDRNNINYKIQTTPESIDHLINYSLTKDIGINKAYNALTYETRKFTDSVESMSKINAEFGGISKKQALEITKRNPSKHWFPYYGIYKTVCRDNFMDKVRSDLKDVEDDWSQIKTNFDSKVDKQKADLKSDFDRLDSRLELGSRSTRNEYKNAISKLRGICNDSWSLNYNKYYKPNDEYMNSYVSSVYNAVDRRQDRKAGLKLLFAAVGGGLVPGLDVLADIFGSSFADLFVSVADDISDMIGFDVRGKLDNLYRSLPDSVKPEIDADFVSIHDMLTIHDGDITSPQKFESTFQNFLSSYRPEELAGNLADFKKSVNIQHLDGFVRASGDRIFLSSVIGVSSTLLRNYEQTGTIGIQGLWKDIIYNVVVTPIFAMGNNFVGNIQYSDIHLPDEVIGVPMPQSLKDSAQKLADSFEGNVSKDRVITVFNYVRDKMQKPLSNGAQSVMNDFFADMITGKPIKEKQMDAAFKEMSDMFVEFSNQVDNLENINKILPKSRPKSLFEFINKILKKI